MSANDDFLGPLLKVERANQHIAEFVGAQNAFFNTDFDGVTPELDEKTGEFLGFKYQFSGDPLPRELNIIAADALYNLRSSLDQTVCACVKLTGKSTKNTYFPHGKDLAGFEASIAARCKKVPVPIIDCLRALQPYYGGNGEVLRVIHDLNIVDKHTELLTLTKLVKKFKIRQTAAPSRTLWNWENSGFDGPVLKTDHHYDAQMTLAITFNDVEIVKLEPAISVLRQASDHVSGAISAISAVMIKSSS